MVVGAEWSWGDEPEQTAIATTTHVPHPINAHVNFGWDGQKYPGGWNGDDDAFIDHTLALDYFTLRQRSSQLFDTNLYGRGIIRRLVTNEVHTGLDLEAAPTQLILELPEEQLELWAERVEVFFNAWANSPLACDHEQRPGMDLGGLTAEARREALVGGDVLVVLRENEETKRPTVQLVGGHLVQTPLDHALQGEVEHGVELDANGRHVAYHVMNSETGMSTRVPAFGANSGRRVAWLMYGTDKRIGQVRGAPMLSIVLQSLREIDRYRDSTQRKAIINSILSLWIEKGEDKPGSNPLTSGAVRKGTTQVADVNGNASSVNFADKIPGYVIENLQVGEKPHAFKSDGGDTVQFPEFEASIIAAVAWACEIPPEILRLSFDSNYSASQAALNEFTLYLQIQRTRIAKAFSQLIYEEWLASSVLNGTIQAPGFFEAYANLSLYETKAAWVNAAWIGAVKPVTDMLKMAKAFEIMVDRGWTTNARVSRMLTGTKWSDNARILLKEREVLPTPEAEALSLQQMEAIESPDE